MNVQTVTPDVLREYRKQRVGLPEHGVSARIALDNARRELALQDAEDAGRIRFVWEYDANGLENCDWENAKHAPTDKERHEHETWARRTDRAYEQGLLTVECCMAQIPVTVTRNGRYTPYQSEYEDWSTAAALGGIELDVNDRFNYRREVECELALEAGVIS